MTLDPVRFSRLKLMAKSPAHFKSGYNPPTEAMQVGTAVHEVILRDTSFTVYDGVRRGKEWDAFKADQPAGRLIFNVRENAQVAGMVGSIRANQDAMRVLEGEREVMRTWQINGRDCQGTPDVVSDRFVTELKTGETSDPALFRFKVLRYGYHSQLAWYRNGVLLDTNEPLGRDCYIVAVESKAPFVTTVFKVTEESLTQGEKTYRLWWERLLACEAADAWPGYAQNIVDLDVGEVELTFGDETDD